MKETKFQETRESIEVTCSNGVQHISDSVESHLLFEIL